MDAPIPRVILSPEFNHQGQNTHESGAGLNHSRERLHQHLFPGLQAPPFLLQDQKAVGQAHRAQHARALPPGHIDPQHPVVPTGNDSPRKFRTSRPFSQTAGGLGLHQQRWIFAATSAPNGWPASASPASTSSAVPSPGRSDPRRAKPSMAELVWDGTFIRQDISDSKKPGRQREIDPCPKRDAAATTLPSDRQRPAGTGA